MSQRYSIFYNGSSIYEPGNSSLQLIDPVLQLEVSAAGSLEMTVPPGNTYYSQIDESGEVRVTDSTEGGSTIWTGRVTECETDLYGRKHIYAEGALAFLMDSVQLEGSTKTGTVQQILQSIIATHNSQVVDANRQFDTTVTISGFTGSYSRDTDDSNTLDTIKNWFIKVLGGYLLVTYSSASAKPRLNYVSAFTTQCSQTIELGKNLLDYSRRISTAGIVTAVIPRGADGLTASTVYSSAVSTYGRRYVVKDWSDVTSTAELTRLAQEFLASGQWGEAQFEITAADLHGLQAVDAFHLGDLVRVVSTYHGIDTWLPVCGLTIQLDRAGQEITLGTPDRQDLTAYNRENSERVESEIEEAAESGGSGGGLPAGGAAGQMLTKLSAADQDAGWVDKISFVLQSEYLSTTAVYDEGSLVVVLDG